MTKECIEDMREVVLPYVKKRLLEINYENLGESDAEEFAREFNEILDLAIKALEKEPVYTSQIAQKAYEDGKKDGYVQAKLEQEPILDKIRAEIAEYGSIWVEYTITDNSVSGIEDLIEDVLEQAKEQVLQIIDKYQTQETHEKCTENAWKTHGIFTTGV